MKRRVQYYETDMMGITHHSNYIRWMEEARIDLLDQMGFPYQKMEEDGVVSPVKSIRADYLKPCSFGDEVEITVSIQDFNGVVLTIAYSMSVRDEVIFRGTSEHVFLNTEGRIIRMRKEMPEFCAAVEEQLNKKSEP